MIFMFTYKV